MSTPDPDWVNLRRQLVQLAGADNPDPQQLVELTEKLHARYTQLQRGGVTAGGLPYPYPLDPVAEGADAIRALAEAIPVMAAGSATSGTVVAPGGFSDTAIQFPAGRFATSPLVFASSVGYRFVMSVNAISAAGCNLRSGNWSGVADAPGTLRWFAIAVNPSAAEGADPMPLPGQVPEEEAEES